MEHDNGIVRNFTIKKMNTQLSVTGVANMHIYEFVNSFKNEKHFHSIDELVYIHKGQIKVDSDNFSGILGKGELYIHKKNSVHKLTGIGKTKISLIILSFETETEKIESITERPIIVTKEERKLISDIIREGKNVFSPPYSCPTENMKKKKNQMFASEQMLTNYIETLFIKLIRRFSNQFEQQTDWAQMLTSVKDVVNYINENFLEKITINDLTILFNTNRSTLCKKFKEATGKTLNKYIADKKIAKAKELILQTNKSFTEIAEELNFETIQHFSHFFIKNTSVSPSQFKKLNKKS